uniref:Uncharacterized protein n=1 Tax=Ceratitis capitata TaxID=7213 RepID=W8AQG5_CERCA
MRRNVLRQHNVWPTADAVADDVGVTAPPDTERVARLCDNNGKGSEVVFVATNGLRNDEHCTISSSAMAAAATIPPISWQAYGDGDGDGDRESDINVAVGVICNGRGGDSGGSGGVGGATANGGGGGVGGGVTLGAGAYAQQQVSVFYLSHGCFRQSAAVARFARSNSNIGTRKSAKASASSRGHSYFSDSTSTRPHGFKPVILRNSPLRLNACDEYAPCWIMLSGIGPNNSIMCAI